MKNVSNNIDLKEK